MTKNNKRRFFIDQYGLKFWASSIQDLRKQLDNGGSRVSKMYCDKLDGTSVHVGYCIGDHWCKEFAPVERPA